MIILPPPTKTPRRNLGFGRLLISFEIKYEERVVDNRRRFTAWIFEGKTGLLRKEGGILLRLLTEVILLGMGAQEGHLPSDCRSLGRSPILPGGASSQSSGVS